MTEPAEGGMKSDLVGLATLALMLSLMGCTERGCLIDSACPFPLHPEAADWRRVQQICTAEPDKCATAVSVMQDAPPNAGVAGKR